MITQLNTTTKPNCTDKLYIKILYSTVFIGPFDNLKDTAKGICTLNSYDAYWDYNGYNIIRGLNPLPKDFVFGFPTISDEEWGQLHELIAAKEIGG